MGEVDREVVLDAMRIAEQVAKRNGLVVGELLHSNRNQCVRARGEMFIVASVATRAGRIRQRDLARVYGYNYQTVSAAINRLSGPERVAVVDAYGLDEKMKQRCCVVCKGLIHELRYRHGRKYCSARCANRRKGKNQRARHNR